MLILKIQILQRTKDLRDIVRGRTQLWERLLYSPDLNPLDFNCSVQAPFELVVGYVINF
jgi:hypothetical protein